MTTLRNTLRGGQYPLLLSGLLLAAALFLPGCGRDEVAPKLEGGSDNAFQEVLDQGNDFEQVTPAYDEVVHDAEEEEATDGTIWLCTRKTVSAVNAPDGYSTFDPNADVIYPGSLLQGATLDRATPDPIVVPRAGGRLSIDLNNGSPEVTATVESMTESGVRQAMNEIIANNNGIGAARFDFNQFQVHSREQLAASLGVNVSTLSSSFNAKLSFSTDQEYNRWLVQLNQSYYTIVYDKPATYSEVFAPEVTPEMLDRYVGPGNPAVYVSSVTYGRIFYLLVETTASRQELAASVEASFSAAVAGGGIEGDVEYVSELENSHIKVFALGGDEELALATFSGDFEAVRDFLTQGGDIATGRPLSYTLRALKDNSAVKVKVASDYDIVDCQPVAESLERPIVWYNAEFGLDANGPYGMVSRWKDSFSKPEMDAVPRVLDYGGLRIPNGVNNRKAYVSMSWDGSLSEGGFGFSGANFRNTDYTIFAVLFNSTNPDDNRPVDFLYGESTQAGRGLRLGFTSNTGVYMSHGDGYTLSADMGVPSQAFRLYTFRYSQTEGMSIYVDGAKVAEDRSLTLPLSSFSGATLGGRDGSYQGINPLITLNFAEFRCFGIAATEAQRASIEREMLVKYGL